MASRFPVRDLSLLLLVSAACGGEVADDDTPAAVEQAATLPRGGHVWTKRFGGASLGGHLVADGNGAVVASSFSGTIDLGDGPRAAVGGRDLFVARVDPFGEITWGRTFEGSGDDGVTDIVRDGDGSLYLTGAYTGDLDLAECGVLADQPEVAGFDFPWFIAKLDASGRCLWAREYVPEPGAWSVRLSNLALDPSGNVFVVGEVSGTLDLGGGVTLATPPSRTLGFVAKLNPDGDPLWGRVHGETNEETPWAQVFLHEAEPDGAGGVVVTGGVIGDGSVDLGNGSIGADRSFVASLDGDGVARWSHDLPFWDVGLGGGLATNAAGDIAFAGWFQLGFELDGHALVPVDWSTNAYVAKLAPDGSAAWVEHVWGVSDPRIYDLAVTPGGNVIMAGGASEGGGLHIGGTRWEIPQQSQAMFVARLGITTGSTIWARIATGLAGTFVSVGDVAVSDNGRVMVYGNFGGAIDLGGGMTTASTRDEGFLVRYYP